MTSASKIELKLELGGQQFTNTTYIAGIGIYFRSHTYDTLL